MSQFLLTRSGYRGALVYRQENGYMTITLTISIAPGERSHVITHAYNLPIAEDAEHLSGVDLYHFPVTEGTRIQLIITSPTGTMEAWYTMNNNTVLGVASPIHLSIVPSSESIPPVPEHHFSTNESQPIELIGRQS